MTEDQLDELLKPSRGAVQAARESAEALDEGPHTLGGDPARRAAALVALAHAEIALASLEASLRVELLDPSDLSQPALSGLPDVIIDANEWAMIAHDAKNAADVVRRIGETFQTVSSERVEELAEAPPVWTDLIASSLLAAFAGRPWSAVELHNGPWSELVEAELVPGHSPGDPDRITVSLRPHSTRYREHADRLRS